MIVIVNFSHPIAEGRRDITKIVGDDYKIYNIPVQIDQSLLLMPQVRDIFELAMQADLVGHNVRNVDCVVLPGLAVVAVALVKLFREEHNYMPNILRFAPAPGAMPPRFEAVELIRW